jgi:hypothetical protein
MAEEDYGLGPNQKIATYTHRKSRFVEALIRGRLLLAEDVAGRAS